MGIHAPDQKLLTKHKGWGLQGSKGANETLLSFYLQKRSMPEMQ